MDNGEIIIYDGSENPLSYKEIRKYITEGNESDITKLDKFSNWYEKIHPIFRIVAKNLDKTGIISGIDEFLTEHKSQKQQERLIIAFSLIYDKIIKNESQVRQSMSTMKDEFPELMEEYFNKCKESSQLEKLQVFRDIWFNCITNSESSYNEKEYVFNLVSELTVDHINVLKYIYQQLEKDLKEKGRDHTAPIGVEGYAKERGLPYSYVQQICVNLVGKGLLNQGAATFIQAQPIHFLPSAYIDTLIEYLKSYD